MLYGEHKRIVELAAKNRLPAMYAAREFVEDGGLMSYGPSLPDVFRRAAIYVDKILKGADPADLRWSSRRHSSWWSTSRPPRCSPRSPAVDLRPSGRGDRVRRRQFSHLFGALVGSTPFSAFGQSKDKPTVGALSLASEAVARPYVESLRDGLGKYGLVDGSTLRLVVRYADARPERLADLVRDLATQGSRVIVTSGTTAVDAARLSAPELPIVMAGSAIPC
jgi:ABC-type uncharacterized transport system substrate-binding protein